MCPCCSLLYFDDAYFKEVVTQSVRTTSTADAASCFVGQVPNLPMEHAEGAVGVMSRWWYLGGMFRMDLPNSRARLCAHCHRTGMQERKEVAPAVASIANNRQLSIEIRGRTQQHWVCISPGLLA